MSKSAAVIWFEEYAGPRSFGWKDGAFHAMVGWNEPQGKGVTGKSIEAKGEAPTETICRLYYLFRRETQ